MERTFYSHGKLLISSEYVVLDGAKALAIPTKKGQSLKVTHAESNSNIIIWQSFTATNECWFEDVFSINSLGIFSASETKIASTLSKILVAAQQLNPLFLRKIEERTVVTHLEFPQEWGLGSSSTLINNIAQWANVDAFQLLFKSFKGSGYDIAAAQIKTPFLYQLESEITHIAPTSLSWPFKDQLFFVYLNQKQDSKEGIAHYKAKRISQKIDLCYFSKISEAMIAATSLETFNTLITEHERVISNIIEIPTIKERLFADYTGAIKSLGAWGGDFIMATGTKSEMTYFEKKGYYTIIPFSEMCL